MGYPPALRLDLVDRLHGHAVPDPYRWLEDPGDPRTVAWSAAQDALARTHLGALPGRATLADTLEPLLRAGSVGVPTWRAGRAFYTRRRPAEEHDVLYVRSAGGVERALVDTNAIDPSGQTVLDAWAPSREGTRLAYLTSVGGDEESRLFVLDVATGDLIEGPIERTKFTPIGWLPGGEELIYVRRLPGENRFNRRVWRHKVGSDADEADEVLHGDELDDTMLYGVDVSADGRWLIITGTRGTARQNWLWVADLCSDEPPRQILHYDDDVRVNAWVERDGMLYLHTTDGADRWRLCVTDPANPDRSQWTELVAEDPSAVLEAACFLPGTRQLAVLRTRHAVSELSLHDADTGEFVAPVPLPDLGVVTALSTVDALTPDGRDTLWFGWTDFATPPCVYASSAGGAARLIEAAPGTVALERPHVEQTSFTSADGTTVRMFLLAPVAAPDGPRPALLTGYGGFAISMTPDYNPAALAWVAAGGVYAVASLRGGGEEGEAWHRAGMRESKQNVFDDFHAAGDHLVSSGWTSRDRLAITGGSNGGLLVGAAMTQRPDAYRAVVCAKPLLDMARYEGFLIGRYWSHEYGTAADPTELDWLLSYSPYHHVVPGTAYPAVLFTSYESDARTDPCHPRKMCAAMQWATTGGPVLLRREVGVGHGTRAVSRTLALTVDTLGFLAHHVGLST